ncbi:MAG: DUF5916 domain-containing protein [Vicinamibacterales bacterium]
MTAPVFSLALILLGAVVVEAQERERKQAQASRVPDGAIRIDGRLEEDVWRSAAPLTGFVQREPDEGATATDGIDVRFVFDSQALYVGARMSSNGPIQAPLGRRDEGDQAEHLHIALDTYLDRRTASTFGITATGVRLDTFFASDDDNSDDETFSPVWQGRTSIDGNGWTAELWIPFSQLRFNDRTPQVWGLNVRRWIPSRNEDVFWSPMRRTDERWASLFGDLRGLDGIRPRRRLELLPYVAGGARVVGTTSPGDPFSEGANLNARAGGDLKLGIGSNLTLEATVNPDFGQVEADPAVVNLSAFETFFDEKRPFFVEGANLLTGNVNNYFYSRRIGASPAGRAEGDFVEFPNTTTILGAAKLTGRLSSGMSIGMLGAVTDNESARTFTTGTFGRTRVAPRTAYGVGRVQQELGQAGSTVALMATSVHRQFAADDPLSLLLTRKAFTLSGDSVLRFGDHEMQSYLGVSHVDGESQALTRLQRSSARYFQRPDADYVRLDPQRTSMSGAKGGVSFERQNARHWTWEAASSFETPEFETNDLGRVTSSDGIQISGEVEYQNTQPKRLYREYSFTLGQTQEWNYGGDRQTSQVSGNVSITWPNFWESEISATYDFRRQDMRLTRGGPSMEAPAGWGTTFEVESSDAAQTQLEATVVYGRNEDHGLTFSTETRVTFRPGPQWQLSLTPKYEREVVSQQYVATFPGGGAATYGGRYIFAEVDRSTYSAQMRLNYTFKPDLNLDFYAEPFAASGQYVRLGQLAAARGRLLLPVDPVALNLDDLDFNVRSFRSNLVLRWEWRPGSMLYLVWQQDRAADALRRGRAGAGDLFRSFGAEGDNLFAVKASYWFSAR